MSQFEVNDSIKGYNLYIEKDIKAFYSIIKVYSKKGDKLFIITDSKIAVIYKDLIAFLEEELDCLIYVFNEGEENKNFSTVSGIYDFLIDNKADRNSILIAVGGGIVGDITGFAAATFMRGIRYISMPTTLISQVDSSIGGKVGYNYKGVKNVVGAFYNPEFVYITTSFLKTLSREQFLDGLGEVIKYGLIAEAEILVFINKNYTKIFSAEDKEILWLVQKCLKIKAEVIAEDYKDVGIRNILNFGHTVGHGIEVESKYTLSHGVSVALGMLSALKLSEKYTGLSNDAYTYIVDLYIKLGLPTTYKVDNYESFMYAIRHDKKNNEKINFVLLENIGKCKIKVAVNEDDILWAVNNSLQED